MSLVSIGATTAALLILVLLILRRGRGLTGGHNLAHFFINFSSARTIRTHRRVALLFQSKRQIHSDGALIGVGLNSTILDLLRLRNPVPSNAQLSDGLVRMIKLHMLRPRVVMRNPAGGAKISPINLPRIGVQSTLIIPRARTATRIPCPQRQGGHINSDSKGNHNNGERPPQRPQELPIASRFLRPVPLCRSRGCAGGATPRLRVSGGLAICRRLIESGRTLFLIAAALKSHGSSSARGYDPQK